MTPLPEQSDGRLWWIIYPGGQRFGPFESLELAVDVRSYVERCERREDLAVEEQAR